MIQEYIDAERKREAETIKALIAAKRLLKGACREERIAPAVITRRAGAELEDIALQQAAADRTEEEQAQGRLF